MLKKQRMSTVVDISVLRVSKDTSILGVSELEQTLLYARPPSATLAHHSPTLDSCLYSHHLA